MASASTNPWVWAALWPASFRRLGLLTSLAEAAGATVPSIRNAACRMRIRGVEKMKYPPPLCFDTSRDAWEVRKTPHFLRGRATYAAWITKAHMHTAA